MPRNGKLVRITLALAAVTVGAVSATGVASARSASTTLNGTGSTFVAPLVQLWVSPVSSALGITLNYSPLGSGAGIAAITGRTADFGASDAPLTASQFAACNTTSGADQGPCIQIPWAQAGTAAIYHINGVNKALKITGAELANIYLGNIVYWNAPQLRKTNKGVKLPHLKITVVYRSDGSGTTYNWTQYLSDVSSEWLKKVGFGTAVDWPVGIGEPHSSGVSAEVVATNGAIGYADVDYALVNHLKYFDVANAAGKFIKPTLASIKAAGEIDTKPAKDGSLSIVDPSKKYAKAYPICTYTYVIVAVHSGDRAAALKSLITWAITKGQSYGPQILFVPLSKSVVTFDKKQIAKIQS